MAEITATLVKDLREKSGVGMMDCKKALQENDGDIEAAMDWLRTKGLSKAAKKADRVAAEGLVTVATEANGAGMTAAAVEVNAETDFVSRNELFQNLARKAGVAGLKDGTVEGVAAAVSDELTNLIATIGENMVVRRVARYSVDQGVVASYIHNAIAPDLGRIAVLVAIESAGDPDVLKDVGRKIAMHVAATQPLSLSTDDLDQAAVEREKAIFTEQALASGKPAQVVEKMVEGRIRKFFEEVVLMKQAFVMNPDQTIEQLVADTAKGLGTPVTVKAFTRLALGEGVEKKVDDFAAEVASMTGGV
ncbi:translation elongation factor Ts [Asticcacaulis sp. EMRT-3]|uniref:translation elongation factor Ts n=1 Tax=Asticcacaulis sp. EMRT-3 TaxID=3040349 RepID=UPI0024AFE6D7|nr:translation elongation factor Ts [Asticcacaulis sp. EMRT-3]MDI7774848.1 translation elongation factor Ts [Asticcacaulis sp. EMRT-3]